MNAVGIALNAPLTVFAKERVWIEAQTKTLHDQLRASEEELQAKSTALLQADRQLADNQAELAKNSASDQSPPDLGFDDC